MLKEKLSNFPKIVLALAIQGLALGILAISVLVVSYIIPPPYPLWLLVMIQGVLAAFLSCRVGLPCWWRLIQFSIPVGLYWGVTLHFSPLLALGVFVVMLLVFWNTSKERVPLYLTNATTREALKKLVKHRRHVRFLDLGSGLGGNVVYMSQLPNVSESHGVETAPLPFLLSRVLTLFRGGRIFAMNLWQSELSYYDVVYAFLSPEPMSKLWEKVKDEMEPGSIFVSNSFAVEGVEPSEVWTLNDSRQTKLYLYKIS
jgi:hypothetical protein